MILAFVFAILAALFFLLGAPWYGISWTVWAIIAWVLDD